MSDPGHEPINQKINHSINSWFLVLGFWCLGLGSYCFFDSPGAHMGVRQGGVQGDVPRPYLPHTTLQLRLKIGVAFDTFFLRFWLHLGSQDGAKNRPKSLKNHLPNIQVERIDERFTSKISKQIIIKSGIGKKNRRDKLIIDKISASLILESYLIQKNK